MHISVAKQPPTSLLKWSIDTHLHFNVSKFVFIHFHPKFNTEYNIDGFNIPCSSVCKDFGITFSNDLFWKQVDIISKNQALQI